MKLIGLTGGIGSGKTTVTGMFSLLGIPVYESDTRAKWLMQNDDLLREKIIALFGVEAYLHGNELNTSFIAARVFSNKDQLDRLNDIVHPAVYEDLVKWANEKEQTEAPYLIQESAILFEEDLTERLIGIITVVADEQTRIDRVIKRDQTTHDHVARRIKLQWPDEKKIPLSDFVIYNDGNRSIISQVRDIDETIRKLKA